MKTCGYIVSGCCHFILPQNLPKETPHNRARPDLPDFPGTRPLRQRITYDDDYNSTYVLNICLSKFLIFYACKMRSGYRF